MTTAICKHVRFDDCIESIDAADDIRRVQFDDNVSTRETFRRKDLSRLEAASYFQTPMDLRRMKREVQTSKRDLDPTLDMYQPESVLKTRATIRRSKRAVFHEQEVYAQHLSEQATDHVRHSKIKGPCYLCTCHSRQMALAYRLATREAKTEALGHALVLQEELFEERLQEALPEALEEETVWELKGEINDEVPPNGDTPDGYSASSKRKLDRLQRLRRSSTRKRSFVAPSASTREFLQQ